MAIISRLEKKAESKRIASSDSCKPWDKCQFKESTNLRRGYIQAMVIRSQSSGGGRSRILTKYHAMSRQMCMLVHHVVIVVRTTHDDYHFLRARRSGVKPQLLIHYLYHSIIGRRYRSTQGCSCLPLAGCLLDGGGGGQASYFVFYWQFSGSGCSGGGDVDRVLRELPMCVVVLHLVYSVVGGRQALPRRFQ